MSATYIIGLLIIGFAAGFISSMVGIGGGIVIVPALVFFYGMNQKMAQGISLSMLALPVAAAGAYNYYKAGHVDWRISLLLAVAFVVGGALGGKLVVNLPVNTVKKVFAVLMIVMGIKYLFFDKPVKKDGTQTEQTSNN